MFEHPDLGTSKDRAFVRRVLDEHQDARVTPSLDGRSFLLKRSGQPPVLVDIESQSATAVPSCSPIKHLGGTLWLVRDSAPGRALTILDTAGDSLQLISHDILDACVGGDGSVLLLQGNSITVMDPSLTGTLGIVQLPTMRMPAMGRPTINANGSHRRAVVFSAWEDGTPGVPDWKLVDLASGELSDVPISIQMTTVADAPADAPALVVLGDGSPWKVLSLEDDDPPDNWQRVRHLPSRPSLRTPAISTRTQWIVIHQNADSFLGFLGKGEIKAVVYDQSAPSARFDLGSGGDLVLLELR